MGPCFRNSELAIEHCQWQVAKHHIYTHTHSMGMRYIRLEYRYYTIYIVLLGKIAFFLSARKTAQIAHCAARINWQFFLGFVYMIFFFFSCAIYANDNIYILQFNRFGIHRILDGIKAYHQSQDVIRSNGNWFSILMVISMRRSFELVGASINCLRGGKNRSE